MTKHRLPATEYRERLITAHRALHDIATIVREFHEGKAPYDQPSLLSIIGDYARVARDQANPWDAEDQAQREREIAHATV